MQLKLTSRVFLILLIIISATSASENKKVSLQLLWKHQFQFAGYYIAKEKGFYKDVGLDVNLKEYEFGINITDDVLTENSDFAVGRSSLIIDKMAENKEILLLAAIFQHSPLVLHAKKGSGINSLADIKGKKIMATPDAAVMAAINAMLVSNGLYKNDYKKIKHSFNYKDLINEKTDLMASYISNEPFRLKEDGYDSIMFHPKDYGFDFYGDILFTSLKLSKTNPELVNNFYTASLKGWEYAFSHIEETVDLILKKYNTQNKTRRALIYEAKELKKLAYVNNIELGNINHFKLNSIVNTYYLLNLMKNRHIDLTNFVYESNKKNYLTQKEEEYLLDNKVIKMCNNPNWEPIEFYNNKTNELGGIVMDTVDLLEKKLDNKVKFLHIYTESWSQSQEFLEEKKCDILPAAIKTSKREKYAVFTEPYLNYKLAIITKDDKPLINSIDDIINNNYTIARKKGSGLIQKLKRKYSNVKIIETKDYLEALQKVSSGQVYCTIATLPVASYYISKFSLNSLHISGYTNMTYSLSMAVRNDKVELNSILNKTLKQISQEEHQKIYNKWVNISLKEGFDYSYILKIAIFIFIITLFLMYRQFLLKKQNKDLERLVDEKTYELKEINENLEQNIIIEVEKNRIKDKQLFDAEKMVTMGEMIGNIAHQWRQPLSAISTVASSIQVNYDCGVKQSEKQIIDDMDTIIEKTKFLSETIDTFRDFIKEKKELKEVVLQERINKALNIVNTALENNHIKLKKDIDETNPIMITMIIGELSQVIINIVNNAKDVLLENKIADSWINVELTKKDDIVVITIEDNGGGISDDVMPKIFNPYFTTKHQSQGTGLGLHMSYKIITESLGGKLYIKNTINGAKFFIELPLNKGK